MNCETNIDDCAVNPCNNGGSCIDLVNDYMCVCSLPYTGQNCHEKLDPCEPNRYSKRETVEWNDMSKNGSRSDY